MSTLVRRNLLARIIPAAGQDLRLEITALSVIKVSTTGLIATLVALGGTAPYVFSIIAGALPTNTALDSSTGKITTTGTLVRGTYTFTAQAQDVNGVVRPRTFKLVVTGNLVPIAFLPPDITAARSPSSQPYQFFFEVSGNVGAVTWSLPSGTLPTGIVLTTVGNKGRIGTSTGLHPSTITVYYFTVRATDAGTGETLDIPAHFTMYPTQTFTWNNGDPGHNYYFPNTELPACIQNVPTTYQVNVAPGTGKPPFTWQCFISSSLVSLPDSDIVLTPINNGNSCLITVTTNQAVDIYNISMHATDANGYEVTADNTNTNPPGYGAPSAKFRLTPTQVAVQPRLAGVDVGQKNFGIINFAGGGFASLTNVNGTVTVTVPTGAGGVTSVALTMPSIFTVGGSPVTTTGTIAVTLANATTNFVFAGPSSGGAGLPTFRALVIADLPATLQRLIGAQAPAGDTVQNTAAATAFATTQVIAATDLKAGCLIRIRAQGSYGTTGTPTLTLQLRLSGTTVLTIGALTMPNGAPATSAWVFEGDIFIPSIGGSVACRACGFAMFGVATSIANNFVVLPQSTAIAQATNASKTVSLVAKWSAANVSNTITLLQLDTEVQG